MDTPVSEKLQPTSVVSLIERSGQGVEAKEAHLEQILRGMGSVLVAFSGGVDSSYLALVAFRVLGLRSLAVTGISPSLSEHQREQAASIAKQFALPHETISTSETADPRYIQNSPDRCYFCKSELYSKLVPLASNRGLAFVTDGSNQDDIGDHRPGRTAAAQMGVRSPLLEAGMTKADVRELSRRAGLPTWDTPASPCLSSRIAYGTPVTLQRLSSVERGEQILRDLGFREFRVRHHGDLARLEIESSEMDRVLDRNMIQTLTERFRSLGFKYVTLDLQGFRSGAMNEVLRIGE